MKIKNHETNFKDKPSDPSNARIMNELIPIIEEFMQKENRGYVFLPSPQRTGNHRTFLAFRANFQKKEEVYTLFWASLLAMVDCFRRYVPEKDFREWKEGFIPTVQAMTEIAFPSIKLFEEK